MSLPALPQIQAVHINEPLGPRWGILALDLTCEICVRNLTSLKDVVKHGPSGTTERSSYAFLPTWTERRPMLAAPSYQDLRILWSRAMHVAYIYLSEAYPYHFVASMIDLQCGPRHYVNVLLNI